MHSENNLSPAACRQSVDTESFDAQALVHDHPDVLFTAARECSRPILITDPSGAIQFANPPFCRQSGYALERLLQGSPRLFRSNRTSREVYRGLWDRILKGETWTGEICNRRRSGEIFWAAETIRPLFGDGDRIRYFIADAVDITERKKAERHAWYRDNIDPLTNLPKRAFFLQCLTRALSAPSRAGRRVTILYIDLDRFTDLNHVYGHLVGDGVLKEAALRLGRCLRESDTLARLGGDEFAVLLPDPGSDREVSKVCERLLGSFEDLFRISESLAVRLGCSIGIGYARHETLDAEVLLSEARMALYANRHHLPSFLPMPESRRIYPVLNVYSPPHAGVNQGGL